MEIVKTSSCSIQCCAVMRCTVMCCVALFVLPVADIQYACSEHSLQAF